ncbi:MAG: oligosaccharide flippase family protein [Chloroflexi bacterium]|nr:oligosaccharide flippase family protein [Chloroflexota bacterium]
MSAASPAEEVRQRFLALARRPFVRDVGVLQLGSFAWLGLSFALSVALARLLGRSEYGAYSLVVSVFTTISLFKRLGQDYVATTDLATGYAKRDPASARMALVGYNWVNLWSTAIVIPAALLLAPTIVGAFYHAPGLADALRLALLPPVWAMLLGTYVLALQATRRMSRLTLVENANQVSLAVAGVLMALLGFGVNGVLLAQAVVSAIAAVLSVLAYERLRRGDPVLPGFSEQWRDIVRVNRLSLAGRNGVSSNDARLRDALFSTFRSGLAVALDKNLVSLYALAPVLLLGAFAPTDEVALLRVALTYTTVPAVALSAVSRVLMVKLPALHAADPRLVAPFFLRVTGLGGACSIAFTLPVVLASPLVIGGLYGASYESAAALVPFLALDPLLAGFGIAAGPLFRMYRRNMWAVYANLGVLVVGVPLAAWLTTAHGLSGAALGYALLVTALRATAYVLCLRLVRQQAID